MAHFVTHYIPHCTMLSLEQENKKHKKTKKQNKSVHSPKSVSPRSAKTNRKQTVSGHKIQNTAVVTNYWTCTRWSSEREIRVVVLRGRGWVLAPLRWQITCLQWCQPSLSLSLTHTHRERGGERHKNIWKVTFKPTSGILVNVPAFHLIRGILQNH